MRGLDKWALVTGATGHIGKSIVKRLSEEGACVWAASRDLQKAEEFVGASGLDNVYPCQLDLSDKQSIDYLFARFYAEDSVPQILVANASLRDGLEADSDDLKYENFANLFSVDIGGHFFCAKHMPDNSSIVLVSSVYASSGVDISIYFDGMVPVPLQYGVVKNGMLSMTRHLASLWGKAGTRVNAVVAGGVKKDQPHGFVRRYSDKTMLGRMAKADEIASSIVFLASDEASYITGQSLIVDGGFLAW